MLDHFSAAFLVFAGSLALAPGPLNLISLMFGASRNVARAAPFILGGAAGFGVTWTVCAASADAIAKIHPAAFEVIKYLAVIYFLWLANGILRSQVPNSGGCTERQPGAASGALLATLNPQTWVTGVLTAGIFLTHPTSAAESLAYGFSYGATVMCAATLWLFGGALSKQVLTHPAVFGLFRYSTAGILVFLGVRLI